MSDRIRSMLFAPGNNERIVSKVFATGADAVALDLEDAVPATRKSEARELVARAIDGHRDDRAPKVVVRVNGPETGLTLQDLEVAVRPGVWGIQFTKVGSPEALARHAAAIDAIERERGLEPGAIRVLCSVDSARLVMKLPELLRATPRMYCVIAGGVDYANDLGVSMSHDMVESLWTRSYAVLASRDAGVHPPLHPPSLQWDDREALERILKVGRQLGFQGGVAIHPTQLATIHDVFAPTEDEVDWARAVVGAFGEAEERGSAAIQVRGQLIDYALVARAEQILAHVS